MIRRTMVVNGRTETVDIEPGLRLIDVLRDRLNLTGTKEGCGEGECGSCSVIVDGTLVLACLTLAESLVDGTRILTVEGLSNDALGARLQRAFLACHAVQCGYCTPGMLLAAHALLTEDPDPTSERIVQALSGNLCRCTGYAMIVEAIQAASREHG